MSTYAKGEYSSAFSKLYEAWKDKINEYYPKETAKKYLSKINESIKYNPHLTYVTMVDNLSYLDFEGANFTFTTLSVEFNIFISSYYCLLHISI